MDQSLSLIEMLEKTCLANGFERVSGRLCKRGNNSLWAMLVRKHSRVNAIVCDIAVFYPALDSSAWRMPKKEVDCHLLSSLGRLYPQFHPAIYIDEIESANSLVAEFDQALKNLQDHWVVKIDSLKFMKEHFEDVLVDGFDPPSLVTFNRLGKFFRS